MSLIDYIEHGPESLVETAVRRIREFEPPEGYYLAFGGGKDSCVIKWLSDQAGVKYDAHYNFCGGLEPPELSRFIKNEHPDVIWHLPKRNIIDAMVYHRFPPTRKIRWCCQDIKEATELDTGRVIMTGIRWAESGRRSKRRMVEICYNDPRKKYVHPIIDWEDEQLWAVIREHKIPYCKLYDEGWTRLGCVLCPMADRKTRLREMERWPHIVSHWKRAMRALFEAGPKKGSTDWGRWKDVDQMWEWWLEAFVGENNDEAQECFRFSDQ